MTLVIVIDTDSNQGQPVGWLIGRREGKLPAATDDVI